MRIFSINTKCVDISSSIIFLLLEFQQILRNVCYNISVKVHK